MGYIEKTIKQKAINDMKKLDRYPADMIESTNSYKQGYANGFVKGFFFSHNRMKWFVLILAASLIISITINILK